MEFHPRVLELLGSKPRNVLIILHEQVQAIVDLRNIVFHVLRTLSAVPPLWRSNEVLRQIVIHLDRDDAPFV